MMHIGNEFLKAFEAIAQCAIDACGKHIECTNDLRHSLQPVSSMVRKGQENDLKERELALVEFVKAALPYSNGQQFWQAEKSNSVPESLREPGTNALAIQYQNECYIELLTGAWLALYFLGLPDGRPWNIVRNWAEHQGGGLPNGACVAKAIGDIIRAAFRAHRDAVAGEREQPGELLMHSFLPMVIFPELIREDKLDYHKGQGAQQIPDSFHHLARAYEMLQFRRYANAGYPYLYSVPARFVCGHLNRRFKGAVVPDENSFRKEYDTVCKDMRVRLQEACPIDEAQKEKQRIVVLSYDRAPACFINDDTGLFTYEAIDSWDNESAVPLPATYMRDDRRQRYYERVKNSAKDDGKNMLLDPSKDTKSTHDHIFAEVLKHFKEQQRGSVGQETADGQPSANGKDSANQQRAAHESGPPEAP
jgi:hypothetical protein